MGYLSEAGLSRVWGKVKKAIENIQTATATAKGLMSGEDKSKLDGFMEASNYAKKDAYVLYNADRYGVLPTATASNNYTGLNKIITEMKSKGGGVIYFPPGTYSFPAISVSDIDNITLLLNDVSLKCTSTRMFSFTNCNNLTVIGGTINGNATAQEGIQITDCKHATFRNVAFTNIGSTSKKDTKGLFIFGDCNFFNVTDCDFTNITSGTAADDGLIHSYGIMINRRGSDEAYSRIGNIRNCKFDNITSTGTGTTSSTFGDGDAIMIQQMPFTESDGTVNYRDDIHITIYGCSFTNCKKRGAKLKCRGVTVERCVFEGKFWYAPVDLQWGNCVVKDCRIINTSDYTGTITSGVVVNDGGFSIEDCYISCPYGSTYHPGIRFNKRQGDTVVPDAEKWGVCRIKDCYFDGVSNAVMVYESDTSVEKHAIRGIEILNCRVGRFNQANPFRINASMMFTSIDNFLLTDFCFDYGNNRTEVKAKQSAFSYPVSIDLDPAVTFEIHSRYWTSEPIAANNITSASPNGCIEFTGDISGMRYKKYTSHGSEVVGTKDPTAITATLAKQLLYNSKLGDQYTNISNGKVFRCTAAGTATTIGTWTEM